MAVLSVVSVTLRRCWCAPTSLQTLGLMSVTPLPSVYHLLLLVCASFQSLNDLSTGSLRGNSAEPNCHDTFGTRNNTPLFNYALGQKARVESLIK